MLGLVARVFHLSPAAVYHLARIAFGATLLTLVWKFITSLLPQNPQQEADSTPNTQYPTPLIPNTPNTQYPTPLIPNTPNTQYPIPHTQHPNARLLSFACVCFSSGLGWLPLAWSSFPTRATCPAGPIDLWQPEAITFLSLSLAPLFLASMCLQLAIPMLLLRSVQTRENAAQAATGNPKSKIKNPKDAILAGICGLLLALVHSYDILTVAAVWTVFLIVQLLRRKRIPRTIPQSSFLIPHSLLAGLITLPGVLLMALQLKNNKVFHARANVQTLSAYPQWLLLGYGLTLLLALYAIYTNSKRNTQHPIPNTQHPTPDVVTGDGRYDGRAQHPTPNTQYPTPVPLTFLTVWAIVNALVSYLPGVAFQRKMLQGEHLPLAILAGIGAAHLIAKYQNAGDTQHPTPNTQYPTPNTRTPEHRTPAFGIAAGGIAAGLLTLLLGVTNLQYLLNETDRFRNHETKVILARPELLPGEVEALNWIAANTPAGTAVQPLPWQTLADNGRGGLSRALTDMTLALATPAIADRPVYCGHWGETPDYPAKLTQDIGIIALARTPDDQRVALLRKMNVQYLVFSQKESADQQFPFLSQKTTADALFPQFRGRGPLPSCLVLVHSNPDADVYAVRLP